MESADILVRSYESKDKESVRSICCATAFMGEDVTKFFENREIFADLAISYYTDYEPQSLFVGEHKGIVIGYIAGCCDTQRYKRIFESRILPKAILKGIVKAAIFKSQTRRFIPYLFRSFIRREFNRPDFSKGFPAHLHINVAPDMRRLGAGERLMNRLLDYFKAKNIPAVQLSSFSKIGQAFFAKNRFEVLYSKKISYFEYLTKEPVSLVYFGRQI